MAVCASCGAEAPAEARFCARCGSPVTAPLETRRVVTVLFSDIVGSTALTETRDPEATRAIVSGYFDEMRAVIVRHGGTVEKFIGDEVMAVFGLPEAHEDDALRAVRAAAEMRQALGALNERLDAFQGVRLAVRTAVSTGEVVAGDPTAGHGYLTGEAVVVAKRLEQAAATGEILVGETTYRLVRDAVIAEPLEPIALKGKADPVAARRLLAVVQDAPAVARRLDSPLVARGPELSRLRTAFDRAASGSGCLLAVLGTPGVGKSRLAHELLDEIEGRATVLRGRCLPYGEGITFWPLADAVRQAGHIGRGASIAEAAERIAGLVADEPDGERVAEGVAAAIGLAPVTVSVEETFWAVRRLLAVLARARPLVVCFDDLHWAEPTFLDLVEHLADRLSGSPVLLLCLARPDLLDLRPEWGRRVEVLRLEPLAADDARTLVENLLGVGNVDERSARSLVDASEGNPLFLEEIVSMLLEDETLQHADGRWRLSDAAAIRMPQTIQALLAARLDRLDPEDRAVLEAAAVMGKLFPFEALADLAPADRIAERVETLVRRELIRPDELTGDAAYSFRHILIQDAAYRGIVKRSRAELHERFASWLEDRRVDRLVEIEELVGYHLEQAFRYRVEVGTRDAHADELARRAFMRLEAGARRATARGDTPAAVTLLERAVALPPADDPDRVALLPDLGAALKDVGDLTRSAQVLEEALERSGAAGDRRTQAHALFQQAFLRLHADPSRTEEALADADRAVADFEELGDVTGLARAWRARAYRLEMEGRLAGIEESLDRALVAAERSGDRLEREYVLRVLATLLFLGPTPVDQGILRCEKLLGLADGNRLTEGAVTAVAARLRAMGGELALARELVAQARDVMEDLGLAVAVATVAVHSGDIALLAGDADAAVRELEMACHTNERLGRRNELATAAAHLASALYARREYREAERWTHVVEDSGYVGELETQLVWNGTRAKLLARKGRLREAEEIGRATVARAEATDFLDLRGDAFSDLAEVLLVARHPGGATHATAEARRLYTMKGNVVAAARAERALRELAPELVP